MENKGRRVRNLIKKYKGQADKIAARKRAAGENAQSLREALS